MKKKEFDYQPVYKSFKKIKNPWALPNFVSIFLSLIIFPLWMIFGIIFGLKEFLLLWWHCLFWQDRGTEIK